MPAGLISTAPFLVLCRATTELSPRRKTEGLRALAASLPTIFQLFMAGPDDEQVGAHLPRGPVNITAGGRYG
jgi:hypothetical protein